MKTHVTPRAFALILGLLCSWHRQMLMLILLFSLQVSLVYASDYYVSAPFGSTVPRETIPIVMHLPANACQPLWAPLVKGRLTGLSAWVSLCQECDPPGELLIIAATPDTNGTAIEPEQDLDAPWTVWLPHGTHGTRDVGWPPKTPDRRRVCLPASQSGRFLASLVPKATTASMTATERRFVWHGSLVTLRRGQKCTTGRLACSNGTGTRTANGGLPLRQVEPDKVPVGHGTGLWTL